VNQNVVVSTAPVSLTNCPGTSASFSVTAIGTGLSYQWFKGGSALSGQTGSSLILSSVSAADAGFTVWWSAHLRQLGKQQRQSHGEPERGGFHRARQPDQLPWNQRQL